MAQAQQAGQPNRQYPKKPGPNRYAHTQNTKYGMGDHYGTGIKAKLGKMRDGVGSPVQGAVNMIPKKLKKPPKSIV